MFPLVVPVPFLVMTVERSWTVRSLNSIVNWEPTVVEHLIERLAVDWFSVSAIPCYAYAEGIDFISLKQSASGRNLR